MHWLSSNMIRVARLSALLIALIALSGCANKAWKLGYNFYQSGEYADAESTWDGALARKEKRYYRILHTSARRMQARQAFDSAMDSAVQGRFEEAKRQLAIAKEKAPDVGLYAEMLAEVDGLLSYADKVIAEADAAAQSGDISEALISYQLIAPFEKDRPRIRQEIDRLGSEAASEAQMAAARAAEREEYETALQNWASYIRYKGIDRTADAGLRRALRGIQAINQSETAREYIQAGALEAAYRIARDTSERYTFSNVAQMTYEQAADAYAEAIFERAAEHERIARELGSRPDAFKALDLAIQADQVAVNQLSTTNTLAMCSDTLANYIRTDIEELNAQMEPDLLPAYWAMQRELARAELRDPTTDPELQELGRFCYKATQLHLVVPEGNTTEEKYLLDRLSQYIQTARLPFVKVHRATNWVPVDNSIKNELVAEASRVGLDPVKVVSPRVYLLGFDEEVEARLTNTPNGNVAFKVFEDYNWIEDASRTGALNTLEMDLKPTFEQLHGMHTELTFDRQEKLQDREDWRNKEAAVLKTRDKARVLESEQQEFISVINQNSLSEVLGQANSSLGTISGLRSTAEGDANTTSATRQQAEAAEAQAYSIVTAHREEIEMTRLRAIETVNAAISRFPQIPEPREIDATAPMLKNEMPVTGELRLYLTDVRTDEQIELSMKTAEFQYSDESVAQIPTYVTAADQANYFELPGEDTAREGIRVYITRQSGEEIARSLAELVRADRDAEAEGWYALAARARYYLTTKGLGENWQDEALLDPAQAEEIEATLGEMVAEMQ